MAYKAYTTRLRFEKGQQIPHKGDSWIAETALSHVRVRVRLLEIKRTFPHATDEGVTLMDARISRVEV